MIKSILFFIGVNTLDVITTIYALSKGGIEGNPIALWAMQYGMLFAIGYKVVMCSIVIFSMLYLYKKGRGKVANVMFYGIGFCIFLVSLNNFRIGVS